jgi:hypothetical protein
MLIAIAARPPERHETRRVSSSLHELDEVRVELPRESLLRVVPGVRQEGERDVRRHRRVAGEDPLLGRADVEDLHALGVRLPQVVGLLGGHVEPQRGLARLGDRPVVVCHGAHRVLL